LRLDLVFAKMQYFENRS